MIIDVHTHTTTHDLWDLHTKTATLTDLEGLAAQYDVRKIILMATYFPTKGTGLHNLDLLRRIGESKLFAMCASLNAMTADGLHIGLQEISLLAREKMIVGIKLYPGYQNFHLSDRRIDPLYELAEKYRLPVTVHTGELHHCCPVKDRGEGRGRCGQVCPIDEWQNLARPSQIIEAATRFPEVNFVLAHLANPYFSELLYDVMAVLPNVYTDISGQFRSGTEEATEEYKDEVLAQIKMFISSGQAGIDRVMFGTDFPIQSYADTVDFVERLGLGKEDKEKIYWRNAARLFALDIG
ncbi:MAG: amidohydrolase family protein [Patescibacteria group bacterium]|jgi:predicted TIM-barrel fold metal-dependent hydrolase